MDEMPRSERKARVTKLANDSAGLHRRFVALSERSETAMARSSYIVEVAYRIMRRMREGRRTLL